MVRRILAELDEPEVAVIATGGLAPIVLDLSETITRHEPDLTLIGLRLVYARNP
jgi:type III pantothenate kinase